MARNKFEGSPADEAEDARGAKALGISKKAYEKTPRDKAEDAAGEERIKVRAHTRPKRKAPPAAPASAFGLAPAPGEANEPSDDDELEGGM